MILYLIINLEAMSHTLVISSTEKMECLELYHLNSLLLSIFDDREYEFYNGIVIPYPIVRRSDPSIHSGNVCVESRATANANYLRTLY